MHAAHTVLRQLLTVPRGVQNADVSAYLNLLHRYIGTLASLQRQHAVFEQ